MASGHWEYRQVWHQTSAAGSGYWATQKVWVADAVKPQPGNIPSAQERAQAAALAAAKRKAAALAAAKRKELLRRQMWERLKNRSKDIRDNIAPPKNTTQKPALDPNDPRYENKVAAQRRAEGTAAAAAAQKKAQDATNARWEAMAKFYERQAKEAKDRADLEAAKKDLGSKASGRTLERLLKEARERQKLSGGQDLNVDRVKEIADLYDKHAKKVSEDFGKKVGELNKLLVKKKGKYYYRDEAAAVRAAKILASPEYKKALHEYDRLYGDGDKDPGQYKQYAEGVYGEIAQQQRTYIREAAKEAFFKGYDQLKTGDKDDRAEAAQMLKDWENGEKYLYEATISEIDPGKTSVKQWVRSKDGGLDPVYRTVEEEFNYRQQQYISEMKRKYEEYKKQEALQKLQEQRNRHMLREDAAYGQARNRDVELLAKTSQALGLDPKKGPTTREEMNRLVDEAMKSWSAENQKWFTKDRPALSVYEQMAWQGKDPRTFTEQAAFQKAYEQKRAELYKVFSSEAPGLLETAVNLPVIKPALQVLGGVGSLPLVLARLEAASGGKLLSAPFGEKFADVGNNTSKLGGVEPTIEQAPPEVQKMMNAAAAAAESKINSGGVYAQMAYGQAGGNYGAAAARRQVYEEWLRTPEGKKWYDEKYVENKKASSAQDTEFFKGVYESGGDIWKVLDALSAYGGSATNNDLLNLGLSLATDPTNAVPLKATTWLARIDHAMNATKNVSGLLGIRRASEVAKKWLTVNEPTLRAEKTFKPYFEALDKGADPAQVTEQILAKIAGDMSVAKDAGGARKVLEKYGIDPRSASGHQLMSMVEERLLETFEKAGVDYRDIAKQAAELEKGRAAKEAAEKAAKSPHAQTADAVAAARENAARADHFKSREALATQRAEEIAAIERRAQREANAARPAAAAPTPAAAAPAPVHAQAPAATPTPRTAAPRNPLHRITKAGPVSQAGRRGQALRHAAGEGLTSPKDVEEAAERVQQMTGARDVFHGKHGEQWASKKAMDDYFASEAGKADAAILASRTEEVFSGADATFVPAKIENVAVKPLKDAKGRVVGQERVRGARGPGNRGTGRPRYSDAQYQAARARVYEAARRSVAEKLFREESFRTARGDDLIGLVDGMIPWEAADEGVPYQVRNGVPSRLQYIPTQSDLAARSGARTPSEEAQLARLRKAFEDAKKRLFQTVSDLETGKIDEAQYNIRMEEIRSLGVVRRSANLERDIASNNGDLIPGVLDEILRGDAVTDFIPVGNILYEDFMSMGHLAYYYDTFTMLPGLSIGMDRLPQIGPMINRGLETGLMRSIMNPSWRAALTKDRFVKVLSAKRFQMPIDEIGPVQFRETGQHLFALFHMALLDRDLEKLQELSSVIDVLLYHEPDNIYGWMWKVMEVRAGVPWLKADETFEAVEQGFISTALLGKRLHPNLALGMIPYGPLARHTPISHGYAGHLRGLATTDSDLVKISPPYWVDGQITDELQQIAARKTAVKKEPISTRESVQRATQIIHYIQSRYGNSLTRKGFTTVLQDFAIRSAWNRRWELGGFDQMRTAYGEWRATRITKNILDTDPDYWIAAPTADDVAAALEEFDMMFGKSLPYGKNRHEYPYIREFFEEQYWLGLPLHTNPGLHTAMFLMKMADPKLARGNSYLRYAEVFYDNMVLSGAKEEAEELLKILFEPEIRRVAGDAYEQMLALGKGVGGIVENKRWVPNKLPKAGRFFLRANIMPDLSRIRAEGAQRVRKEKTFAESEVANLQMRDEFTLEDAADVKTADDIAEGQASMYDFADIDYAVQRASSAHGMYSAASAKMDELVTGTATSAPVPRPSDKIMRSVYKKFYTIRKAEGAGAAFDYLRKQDSEIRKWITAEMRFRAARAEMTKAMNSILFRLLDVDAIPSAVDNELNDLMKLIGDSPVWKGFLAGWADNYARELYASRLIDYLRHQDWFDDLAKKEGVGDLSLKPTSDEIARVHDLDGQISIAKGAGRPTADLEKMKSEAKALVDRKNREYAASIPKEPEVPKAGLDATTEEISAEILDIKKKLDNPRLPAEQRDALERRRTFLNDRLRGVQGPEAPSPQQAAPPVTPPPVGPSPADLNNPRVQTTKRVLEMLTKETEEDWLARQMLKAQRSRRSYAKGTAGYKAASQKIRDINKALKVIEIAKAGGKGSFIPPMARRTHASKIKSLVGERAKAVFAPKMISPYVTNAGAVFIEQGRTLNRLLRNAPVDPALSSVRKPGMVSDTFKAHRAAIEATGEMQIPARLLVKYGFDAHSAKDITLLDLISNMDEFVRSLDNPNFTNMINELMTRTNARLRRLTGDPTYDIRRWLDDRLVERGEFFDINEWERVEQIVAKKIQEARQGAKRTSWTDLRRAPGARGENPIAELLDTDIRAVVGKTKALRELGIDPHAYNEARRVLRPAYVKKRASQDLVAYATTRAVKELEALGKKVDDADYMAEFQKRYDAAFLARRAEMADEEALKKLDELAYTEMYGSSAEDTIKTFEKRYGSDADVKGFEPSKITPYQRRTLEEAVKTRLSVTNLDDPTEMIEGLSRHGQHPPFHSRAAMREWLAKYGFWSPRTAQSIEAGKKSWSIQEEAKYYIDNWGFTPEWANPDLLEDGAELNKIIHDERLYGEQNRLWGLFNRNMEARFATGKMTREERAILMVEGSESLGIKAKRDLPTERRYVMERYGDLVAENIVKDADGRVVSGDLTAFPWLMNRSELRAYFIKRSGKGAIADNLIQNAEELAIVEGLIEKHIGKYFDETVMAGKPATYADLHGIAANIVSDLLANPVWLKRKRDVVGNLLRAQAEFRRALVFTQLGFLTTNVIDSGIKGAWTAFITRSFRNGDVSAKAAAMTLEDFGLNPLMTQLFTEPVERGTKRFAKAAEEGKVLRQIQGLTEIPAQGAAAAENFTKLRLAQSMYDGVYAMALKRLRDPKLADAAAREFIGKEVSRLWPTVGDGPIEQLFNNISPFMSYQFKNRVLFISEMASHPAMFNYFNYIGNYIEKQNRDRWEREGTVPDPKNARLIELPWAPGHFIDLGTFSDAQRGLKPLYDAADGKIVVGEFMSQFVRLAGPNDINFALGILNALKLPMRTEYVQRMDEDGYPTGVWDEVEVPWEAPWGGKADLWNSFWPVEWNSAFGEAMKGKFSVAELTKLAYRTLFFGQLKQTDKGAALNAVYYALKEKDPDAAEAWLTTADGKALQMWWLDKASESKEWYAPKDFKDILNPPTADPNPWFHSKDKAFQEQVKADLDQLNMIRRKWDNVIFSLTPGTDDYRQAKLRAANERYQFFQQHPELYEFFAFSMTPEEWSQQLDDWTVDDLVDTYYNMKAPKADDYKTAVLWQEAVKKWKAQREAFLKMYPKVAERLGQSRDAVEQVWHDTEQGWFDILDKVGTKSIALEAARQSKDYDLLDQLYLANDLDYKMLNKDVAVHYFNTVTDFVPLERDVQGPPAPRKDPFGHALLPLTKVLPDFNKWRYDRMTVDQKAVYERNMKYGKGMKEIIDAAKKSDDFGATFVEELKKKENKWLLEEYFRRNPGKREKWAENDEYIRLISKYGLLAKAGKFTEAGRYFDSLPPWVKNRYYSKHPERRQKAQENMQYMNYMERWTNYYRKRDYAGGAAFFNRLPKWVKDRYYSKHPENQVGFSGGSSPYSRAMGKWVKLLQEGKKDEAKAYFDSLPKAYKDRYYAKHPDQKIRNNIQRVGQLGEYFAADDANRAVYLKENPNFAKWLRAQGNSESTRRMLVLAAYQGLPKDDQWLRRVFREKYPEIFSQEAKGEQSLKKTYNFLAEHPDMLPGFEKWVEAVWESYAENMKHTAPRPKPIESDHSRQRQHGTDRYPGRHTAKSAAWVRLHSI